MTNVCHWQATMADREKSDQEIFYNNMRDVWEYLIRGQFIESKPTNIERTILVTRVVWEIYSKTTMNSLLTQHARRAVRILFGCFHMENILMIFARKIKYCREACFLEMQWWQVFLSHTAKTSKTSLQKFIGPMF